MIYTHIHACRHMRTYTRISIYSRKHIYTRIYIYIWRYIFFSVWGPLSKSKIRNEDYISPQGAPLDFHHQKHCFSNDLFSYPVAKVPP